ncbi:hypothetical protein LBMAG53_20990 [Planctomycetota bacterium]|nr:hypothetical protein LBMAG53_20990 [Planctomycetota bacterium]
MKLLAVCTGNTCRSPMLKVLLRAELARIKRLDVTVDSAGTGAWDGEPASALAIATMAGLGLDLSDHRSQSVAGLDLSAYDHIHAMSAAHVAALRSLGVPARQLSVVDAEHGGVPDPFGGDAADYAACARVLASAARLIVAELPSEDRPMSDATCFDQAKALIDAAHANDPERAPDGLPAELVYADRVEAEVRRLVPQPQPILLLAARCQHLERWVIPRNAFPIDKPGYLAWRKAVHARQGERAEELLLIAGYDPASATRMRRWVAKLDPRSTEGQALEDAACLVFLTHEIAGFAAEHPDYTAEKFVDIIRKTWRKMSPSARSLALAIPFAEPLASLVQQATRPTGATDPAPPADGGR